MKLKKHVAMALITGLLGMTMITGGTVAYFTSSIESNNEVMSGSLKLGMDEKENKDFHFKFKDIKPGDTFKHTFKLSNDGSLPIGEISLKSTYTSENQKGESTDFGSQIIIKKMKVNGDSIKKLEGASLEKIDSAKNKDGDSVILAKGINPDQKVDVDVVFEFVSNKDKDQNKYQENTLNLNWTFNAVQQTHSK